MNVTRTRVTRPPVDRARHSNSGDATVNALKGPNFVRKLLFKIFIPKKLLDPFQNLHVQLFILCSNITSFPNMNTGLYRNNATLRAQCVREKKVMPMIRERTLSSARSERNDRELC